MKAPAILAGCVAVLAALAMPVRGADDPAGAWSPPSVDSAPDTPLGRLVRTGRDLTVNTSALIGPAAPDPADRYAVSPMSCGNCHLDAGTKRFGVPFIGVSHDFPQYRAREGGIRTLEDRINGCMTRSLNGKALPLGSPQMQAFVAYIEFLSENVPRGTAAIPGRGAGALKLLERAADPAAGQKVYARICAACHGADGQGVRQGAGYLFPPLWGDNSFNDGAGMNRLIVAANFIHSNMPLGTTWEKPVLTPDEAWDVAAYIQAQPRPHYPGLEHDFPVAGEKPIDAGYGPYTDGFDQTQHRLGPFGPIKAAAQAQAAKAATTN